MIEDSKVIKIKEAEDEDDVVEEEGRKSRNK